MSSLALLFQNFAVSLAYVPVVVSMKISWTQLSQCLVQNLREDDGPQRCHFVHRLIHDIKRNFLSIGLPICMALHLSNWEMPVYLIDWNILKTGFHFNKSIIFVSSFCSEHSGCGNHTFFELGGGNHCPGSESDIVSSFSFLALPCLIPEMLL